MAALALALFGASAQAHGPEGSGNLGLSATWIPMVNTNQADLNGQGYQLSVDAPVVNGLSVKADLGVDDEVDHQVYMGSYSEDSTVDDRVYTWGLGVNLYPAGFTGRIFTPGVNANPDGWLWWPSASLRYSGSRSNGFDAGFGNSGGSPFTFSNVYFELDQSLGYQLTMPVATWLSAGLNYDRNLSSNFSQAGNSMASSNSGNNEDEGALVNVYFNLVHGAGADTSRPFLPHFGRLGQMVLSIAWDRNVYIGSYLTDFSNTYSLNVGAPVSASLSAALGASQNCGSYGATPIRLYDLMLTWAFGDPLRRT